jgi:hypothetical protein
MAGDLVSIFKFRASWVNTVERVCLTMGGCDTSSTWCIGISA